MKRNWFFKSLLVVFMLPSNLYSEVLSNVGHIHSSISTEHGINIDMAAGVNSKDIPNMKYLMRIIDSANEVNCGVSSNYKDGNLATVGIPGTEATKRLVKDLIFKKCESITPVSYLEMRRDGIIFLGIDQLGDVKAEIEFRHDDCAREGNDDNNISGFILQARPIENAAKDNFGIINNGAFVTQDGRYRFDYSGVSSYTTWKADTNKHTIILDNNKFYYDGELISTIEDRPVITNPIDIALGGLAPANNLQSRFALAPQNRFCGDVYYIKIYKSNNLVGDFVPAKKTNNVTQESIYGMYNKVSKTFHADAYGLSAFAGGPDTDEILP